MCSGVDADVDDVADLRMRGGRVEPGGEERFAERAVDQPLGAEHLDRLHPQRPARSLQVERQLDVLRPHAEHQLAGARRGCGQGQELPPAVKPLPSVTPRTRFIGGEPMKAATKVVAGR
jgi:hypothetical protein